MQVSIQILLYILAYSITYQFISCLKTDDIRHHLGSRTPYRFKSNKNDTRIIYSYCKDSKIWMIVRHGTRLPSPQEINSIRNLTELKYEIVLAHERGRGQLSKAQVQSLKEWNTNIDIEHEKFLTLEGQDEMILLAERMQKRFPNAVKQKYNNKTFLFRYTPTQRTQQSARYFTNGLFEKRELQNITFGTVSKVDPLLRFYKHCNRWQKQVKKNPETYKQQKLYGISKEMNDTLEAVSKRLGLTKVLKLDTVVLIYKFCGYETSWDKHHMSPWCYAFDASTIAVLEYYVDLKKYWVDGYGHALTYRPACLAINNMLENFRNKKNPRATFLFTHSGTMLKIMTYLGMYKPETHLMGDTLKKDRPWRTSEIDCFATNLAFVLYKCEDGDKLLTLHQEKIVKLPMCEEELCPLELLLEHFHEYLHDCDYSNLCDLESRDIDNKI